MFKNLVILCGFALALVNTSNAQAATAKSFPATMAEFDKYSDADMKALPDVKWPLTKIATLEDTKGKSQVELVLLRNSLFAQTGLTFTQPSIARYFSTRSWYKPSEDVAELTEAGRASAHVFYQAQSHRSGEREVADEGGRARSRVEALAYDTHAMGFCTYKNEYGEKAGAIIFEAGGEAQVFHSVASQQSLSEYEYSPQSPDAGTGKSRLIKAIWSVQSTGPDSARVLLNFVPSAIPKGWNGKPMISAGAREVLSDLNKSTSTWKKDCSMKIAK